MVKNKGFRDGKTKEDFIKSLTAEEWDRLEAMKKFARISPGSKRYDIALYMDDIRLRWLTISDKIDKHIWNINDLRNHILRLRLQISEGPITDELKPGLLMNESELTSQIQIEKYSQRSDMRHVEVELHHLLGLVGHQLVDRTILLTEEGYDEYVGQIEKRMASLGFKIFSS